MKYILIPITVFGLVAAKSERYIISYDEQAWNTMSLRYLPTNTKSILKELRMQVADLDMDEVKGFTNLPGVTLHKNGKVSIFEGGVQKDAIMGLDRIDQRRFPRDYLYHYDSTGKGVDVWVIDTGVNDKHIEFQKRAIFEKNFTEDDIDTDCQGHGTHVSSTVAGKEVGVAKEATIRGVKVLDCEGNGKESNVLAGINYVIQEHKKVPGRKSVINMSLGGEYSEVINQGVKAATEAGITVVVAAGNEKKDACTSSPSSAPEAITVGSVNNNDEFSYFSNRGKCVDILAPGEDVKGAWLSPIGYKYLQGTSMASPHVAGVAALILARGEATTPAEVKARLISSGTKNIIEHMPAETPNVFLYSLKDTTSSVATYENYPSAEVMNLVK